VVGVLVVVELSGVARGLVEVAVVVATEQEQVVQAGGSAVGPVVCVGRRSTRAGGLADYLCTAVMPQLTLTE